MQPSRLRSAIFPELFPASLAERSFRRCYVQDGRSLARAGLAIGLLFVLTALVLSFILERPGTPLLSLCLLAIRGSVAVVLILGIATFPSSSVEPADHFRRVLLPASFAIGALLLDYLLLAGLSPAPPPAARVFFVTSLALWLFCAFARPSSRFAVIVVVVSFFVAAFSGFMADRIGAIESVPYLFVAAIAAASVSVQTERRARLLHERTVELARSRRLLRRKADEAIRARDLKSRVLTTVSHDLRQPLTGARLLLAHFMDGPARDEAMLLRIHEALEAAESTLEELLHAGAATTATMTDTPRAVPLWEVVTSALQEVRPLADEKGIDLHWRNRLPAGTHVLSDRGTLHATFSNLLGNAVKYHHRTCAPWILIRSFISPDDPDVVRVEIVDNGPGISPEHASSVFEPGQRLSRQAGPPGFGLGLPGVIARLRRLESHHLELVPRRSTGARFRLRVPLAHARPAGRECGQQPTATFHSHPDISRNG